MPPEQAAAVLPPRLQRDTVNTITARRELWTALEEIRAQGYAVDREEHTEGICAVGVVVYDADGIAAALSVPVPKQRFEIRVDDVIARLQAAAQEASQLLGGERESSGSRATPTLR